MRILYGTTNQAKLDVMKEATKSLGIEVIGLKDLSCEIPTVNEDGKTPLENAKIKAEAYFQAFHVPVCSCDSGLYFDGLEEEKQPGIFVRRVEGKELSDDEMVAYYGALAENHGGRLIGRYRNAICFILDENHVYSSMDMSLATEPFVLVSKSHPKRVAGFPLDSLSKDIKSGRYYYDLQEKDVSTSVEDGLRAFFEKAYMDFSCVSAE